MQLSTIMKSVKNSVSKHSPEILTGIGIAGMTISAVLAVKATPRAIDLIEKREDELECTGLSAVETIKTTWKCYIPAVVTWSVSVGCIIGASKVNVRKNAALATAYTLSETAFREYKTKVIEAIGEKKEQEIKDTIDREAIQRKPVKGREVVITTKGETLCYDHFSDRYFTSSAEAIRKVENHLERRLLSEGYVCLNDLYAELGLNPLPDIGYDIGWNIDRGFADFSFSSQLNEDDKPCLVLSFLIKPRPDFA